MQYVLGKEGEYGDFSKPGGLAPILASFMKRTLNPDDMRRRRQTMRDRFGWDALAPAYYQMFRDTAAMPPGEPYIND
jgi:hypothetical protein